MKVSGIAALPSLHDAFANGLDNGNPVRTLFICCHRRMRDWILRVARALGF